MRGLLPAAGAVAAVLALLAGACTPAAREPSGRALYVAQCAPCHGAAGRGDGPLAAGLERRPADLTALSTEWQGYPRTHVMGYVDGYYRQGQAGEIMPVFGPGMADATLVPFDAGDGQASPAPLPLLRLAAYVEGLQGDAPPPHPEP